jgi:hypothetical protein
VTRKPPPDPPEGLIIQTQDEWLQVWWRVITTTPTKAVGYAAAQFADWKDGTEVRPGNELLARICGCSTKSVERAFAFMRDCDLMWRYHKAVRLRDADVYRLTVPEDISRVPMLTPDWKYPPDSQSAAGKGLPPDSQSAPDSRSAACPTQSLVLHPTVSRATSVKGDLPTDPYKHANTSPAAVDVEGDGPCDRNEPDRIDAPAARPAPRVARCKKCHRYEQRTQLDDEGYCEFCNPARECSA